MTDTEAALLRAVVAAPGQDTPRLDYADWLDDHGHASRSAFLRAEAEWAAPWRAGRQPPDPTHLSAAAAALDPLWVARVSRPPLGVCCDHFRLEAPGPELTPADLVRVEAEFGFTFPTEYAAFLLNSNGGRLRTVPAWQPGAKNISMYEKNVVFIPVAPGSNRLPECLQERLDYYGRGPTEPDDYGRHWNESDQAYAEWFANRIPVAQGDMSDVELLLAVRGTERGSLARYDWGSYSRGVAEAFTTYLAKSRAMAEFEYPSQPCWDEFPPDDGPG